MTEQSMIYSTYKMLLKRKWTAKELLEDVQNVAVEGFRGEPDEWTDHYCDFLERCVIHAT